MEIHPDQNKVGEAALLPQIADRIKVWIQEGIPIEEKTERLKLVPKRYKDCNMNAPKLNEEVQSNLKEEAVKRDRYFFNYQNMIGSSLSLTASVLSMIINVQEEEIDRDSLIQCLSDAVKMNAELFHSWTIARKVYITPTFNKKVKSVLDKVQPTEYLFGDNVKELINKVQAVEGVGKDLKPTQPKKPTPSNKSLKLERFDWEGDEPDEPTTVELLHVQEPKLQESTKFQSTSRLHPVTTITIIQETTITEVNIAGRLKNFYAIWRTFTEDNFCFKFYSRL